MGVAPEVDSAVGVLAFVLTVTDEKGVKYRENIEVVVKNRERDANGISLQKTYIIFSEEGYK